MKWILNKIRCLLSEHQIEIDSTTEHDGKVGYFWCTKWHCGRCGFKGTDSGVISHP